MQNIRSDNIRNRHSIRGFTDEPIPEQCVEAILEAGLIAPSSKNRQPWKLYVLRNPLKQELIDSMVAVIDGKIECEKDLNVDPQDYLSARVTMDVMSQAPILILVCYEDREKYAGVSRVPWDSGMTDRELVDTLSIGACIENMLLEATERGLGSLWIGDYLYAYEAVKKVTGVDGNIVSIVALGHCSASRKRRHTRMRDLIERLRSAHDFPSQEYCEVEHQKHPYYPLDQTQQAYSTHLLRYV